MKNQSKKKYRKHKLNIGLNLKCVGTEAKEKVNYIREKRNEKMATETTEMKEKKKAGIKATA